MLGKIYLGGDISLHHIMEYHTSQQLSGVNQILDSVPMPASQVVVVILMELISILISVKV